MGAAPAIIQTPSPNFGPRRDGAKPRLIVIHYTAMDSVEAALNRLCDPEFEVSAHYLISNHGHTHQLVDEDQRAWHAGAGQWHDITDVNSHSIGIELDNRGDHPFSNPQIKALEGLLPQLMQRWNIPPSGIIGHSDMAPDRKQDPGRRFDWQRLAKQGLAQQGGSSLAEIDDFRSHARALGYTADCEDETLLKALRDRYRPQGTGPLCDKDIAALPAIPN